MTHHDFTLNQDLSVTLERIGNEREPVLVIDGLMRDASELIDYAATEVAYKPVWGPQGGYPGIRAPAPLDYVESVARRLSPILERAFGLENVRLAKAECSFSLVTQPPGELAPLQRIPHVDTTDPLQFAFLHYLCGPEYGGTAFYRHRASGYESLTAERGPHYEALRAQELERLGGNPYYITGDTEDYVQTAAFEARYDRLLVYRSRMLHSGQIRSPERLSADPRRGRLTANIFVNYRQA